MTFRTIYKACSNSELNRRGAWNLENLARRVEGQRTPQYLPATYISIPVRVGWEFQPQ